MGSATNTLAFRFREWARYELRNKRQEGFVPLKNTTPIVNKFFYTLQSIDRSEPRIVHEGFIHGDDRIVIRDVDRISAGFRKQGTLTSAPGQRSISLPREVDGKRTRYFFYISRIVLQENALSELEQRARTHLPEVDLADPSQFAFDNDVPQQGPDIPPPFLPVVDPLTFAEELHDVYVQAHGALVEFLVKPRTVRTNRTVVVESTAEMRFVGGVFKRLLDGDPDDELDLRGHFSLLRDEASMAGELLRMQKTEKQLDAKFRDAGKRLVQWIDTPFFRFAEDTHKEFEERLMALPSESERDEEVVIPFVEVYEELVRDLHQVKEGQLFLAREIEREDSIAKQYSQPSSPVSSTVIGVLKKGDSIHGKVFDLWTTTSTVILKSDKANGLSRIAKGFNNAFGKDGLELMKVDNIDGRSALRFTDASKESSNWSQWVSNFQFAKKSLKEVLGLFDLASAFKDVLDDKKPTFQRTSAGLSVVNGTLSSATTLLDASGKLTKAALRRISIVGGVISAISDTVSAMDDFEVGDESSSLGHSISALGSAICLTAVIVGSSGVGAIPGAAIAVAGVLLSTVGWLVTVLGKDTPLQTLVAFSWWGEDFAGRRRTGDGSKPWSGGPLKEWGQHPDRIVNATIAILFSFSVTNKPDLSFFSLSVTIRFGVVLDTSKLLIEWDSIDDHDRSLTTKHEFDFATQTLTLISSSKPLLSDSPKFHFGPAASSKPAQLAMTAPRLPVINAQRHDSTVFVRLDLTGSGRFLPETGRGVRVQLESRDAFGSGAPRKTVSSLDAP